MTAFREVKLADNKQNTLFLQSLSFLLYGLLAMLMSAVCSDSDTSEGMQSFRDTADWARDRTASMPSGRDKKIQVKEGDSYLRLPAILQG